MRTGRRGNEEEVGSTLGCLLRWGQSPCVLSPRAAGMLTAGTVPAASGHRTGCPPRGAAVGECVGEPCLGWGG